MGVELRPVAREEVGTVWRMQVEAFSELLEKYGDFGTSPAAVGEDKVLERFGQPWSAYYFIMADGEKVGAVRVVDGKDGGWRRISPIWIMPRHRNKGYAQEAIAALERLYGPGRWRLEAILQEKGSLHLYEKLGYRRTGRIDKVNDLMDIVFYEKDQPRPETEDFGHISKRTAGFMEYAEVQKITKDTIGYITEEIRPGIPLKEVRRLCEEKMLGLGADSFWYWGVGAFVFAGDETAVSVSGREYATSDRLIGTDDIVTIDLSPQVGDTWGDFARTIIVQDGRAVRNVGEIANGEWRGGLETERMLHEKMAEIATPQMTFEELHRRMNALIAEAGYVNLDFMGNLGHSIARSKDGRVYIERGNGARLGDVGYFTFEPHISRSGSKYGYKMENIYYFDGGAIREL